MNPLDWTGPEFLQAYTLLLVAVGLGAKLWQHLLLLPAGTPEPHELDLDEYEVAALDGERTALSAAVVVLAHTRVLAFEDGALTVLDALPATASRLEHSVYHTVKGGQGSLSGLMDNAAPALERLEEGLRRRGFLLTPRQRTLARVLPWLPFAAAWALGATKLMVGMSRNKPVLLLLWELIFAPVLGLALLSLSGKRSRRGSQALELLRQKHAALRITASTGGTGLLMSPSHVVLATGLYGLGALALLDSSPVRDYLIAPMFPGGGGDGGGDSGGCSGGDGGGGCGGGGGGGGGGCGGCGGGH